MQLAFLGEPFKKEKCKGMCDNCRKELAFSQRDYTREGQVIAEFTELCRKDNTNISLVQLVDVMKGRKLKKPGSHIGQYSGALKSLSDNDLKRLVLKLLTEKILKEVYFT
mmetsp:Transcript_1659/g.1591  ORF Transcript_1659/g.1591 Transcript_1659/m.1591 type:complete len:110 (+) Transcript_1659:403-732(+)